jgi:hypothetical protein
VKIKKCPDVPRPSRHGVGMVPQRGQSASGIHGDRDSEASDNRQICDAPMVANPVEFDGIWEAVHNPDSISGEIAIIRSLVRRNSFYLSAKKWMGATSARGLLAKARRYG